MKEKSKDIPGHITVKTKDENGKEIILGYLMYPPPEDLYIYKDGKKYLNDKYF